MLPYHFHLIPTIIEGGDSFGVLGPKSNLILPKKITFGASAQPLINIFTKTLHTFVAHGPIKPESEWRLNPINTLGGDRFGAKYLKTFALAGPELAQSKTVALGNKVIHRLVDFQANRTILVSRHVRSCTDTYFSRF